jgi:hypothetical protein
MIVYSCHLRSIIAGAKSESKLSAATLQLGSIYFRISKN